MCKPLDHAKAQAKLTAGQLYEERCATEERKRAQKNRRSLRRHKSAQRLASYQTEEI